MTYDQRCFADLDAELQALLRHPRIAIVYIPGTRLVVIPFLHLDNRVPVLKYGKHGFASFLHKFGPFLLYADPVKFSPTTGEMLPSGLGNLLEDYCLLKYESDSESRPSFKRRKIGDLPLPEFLSREWWRKDPFPAWFDVIRDHYGERMWDRFESLPDLEVVRKRGVVTLAKMHTDIDAGTRRFPAVPDHLCLNMARLMTGHRIMFAYLPWTREYGPRILDLDRRIREQPSIRIHPVPYCPYCGEAFPPSLRAEWLSHIGPDAGDPDDPALAERHGWDQWWRDRGL